MSLFKAEGLVKQFRGLRATDHVSLEVTQGQVHALIGPNGAGKSTLVNLISGMLAADAGRIELDGHDLTHLPPHRRVHLGLGRCFQVTNLFREKTVLDNLRLAVQGCMGHSFGIWGRRDSDHAIQEQAVQLAEDVDLAGSLDTVAGSLPHGAQRQLDIAMALAARPRLLLLDEPMAGMGPDESQRVIELIGCLRGSMAILLIEHDMDAVFQLADRISVLVYGKVLTSGTVQEIRINPKVQEVYLGGDA